MFLLTFCQFSSMISIKIGTYNTRLSFFNLRELTKAEEDSLWTILLSEGQSQDKLQQIWNSP